jgi:hypothetical protein
MSAPISFAQHKHRRILPKVPPRVNPAGGQRIAARNPATTTNIRAPDFFARL